jgi:hypothetical protein
MLMWHGGHAMAAKRKRNAPETIILRAVNPAEPPKRSRAANPKRSRARNPPAEVQAQMERAFRASEKARRLLNYDPHDLTKAEERKRHAEADRLIAEIYDVVHDLQADGYYKEAEELVALKQMSISNLPKWQNNPRASRTFFLWLDTSGDESGVGEHIDGHFAPLSGAKTAAKRLAKKTGNDVVISEVGGHTVARVYPSGKIDDFESNPRAGNPRAKAATSTSADTAHVAVQHFITHHKVPTGKFGPWGLLTNDEEASGQRTPKYAYGVGRVPTQVIEELDRQGIVFGSEESDTVLGDELVLTIENESSLYPQYQTIANNMAKMMAKGKYDPSKAVVGWRHWVDRGAKYYTKEYPEVEFDVPTRDYAARRVAREFEVEHKVQSGNPRSAALSEHDYAYLRRIQRSRNGVNDYMKGWAEDATVRDKLKKRGLVKVTFSRAAGMGDVDLHTATLTKKGRDAINAAPATRKAKSGNPRKAKSGKVKYTGVLAKDIPALMLEILVDSTVQEVEHYTHTEISESMKDEIEELLVEKAKAVYGGPTGRELAKKSPEAVRDQIRVYMEHWLAAYLKKNDPALLRKLPPGYGWSYSFYLDKSRRRNPTRKANCECQHQNARAKRLRDMDEY